MKERDYYALNSYYSLFRTMSKQLSIMGLGYTANHLRERAFNYLQITLEEVTETNVPDPFIILQALANDLSINITINRYNEELIKIVSDYTTDISIIIDAHDLYIPRIISLASDGDIEALTSSLEEGDDIGSIDNNGNTALHTAALNDETTIIDLLLSADANPNIVNYVLQTPLHIAVYYGNPEVAAILANHMNIMNVKVATLSRTVNFK